MLSLLGSNQNMCIKDTMVATWFYFPTSDITRRPIKTLSASPTRFDIPKWWLLVIWHYAGSLSLKIYNLLLMYGSYNDTYCPKHFSLTCIILMSIGMQTTYLLDISTYWANTSLLFNGVYIHPLVGGLSQRFLLVVVIQWDDDCSIVKWW